jgi:ADP-heptose:LPS heptosyltransferase
MVFEQSNVRLWNDRESKLVKKISAPKIREFGLSMADIKVVNTIEDLRNAPPNIIIAEAVKNFSFIQNWFKKQDMKKKGRYVMGLGAYQQLEFDSRLKQRLLRPAQIKFKNLYKPYLGQDATGKNLLVFRTGGVGDLLFIQPNLRYLKNKYKDCTISFACGPQYQPMVETWDCVDEVLDLPFSLTELTRADYHMLFEGVIERCKEAERINAYNLFSKWLGLDLPDELLVPKQEAKEEKIRECIQTLNSKNFNYNFFILLQLRASSPVRTPSHQFWVKLINELNKRGYYIVITDNPRQNEQVDKFVKMLNKPNMNFNYSGYSQSIDCSIALTKLSKCTLTTDSAFGHIAASLDVPCFGIYGPFPGFIRLKTYKKAAWVDTKRFCAPCFLHGHTPCKYADKDGYSPCYNELNIEDVVNKFEGFLNGKDISISTK